MSYFDHLEKFKKKTALITNNEILSYKDLIFYSKKISKHIKKRSLVMLICQNSLETIISYVGFVRANCVVLLFDNKLTEYNFKRIIKDYEPDYIFLSKNKFSCKINYKNIFSFKEYELLENKNKKIKKIYKKLAILMPTSGSMGSAKFVRQSYENINCNIRQINKFLKIKSTDRTITTMPMNYTYGLSIIHTHLFMGGSIVITEESLFSKNFWKLFKSFKVSNFGGVPYIFEILKKISFKLQNLKDLKYMTQAGGKLKEDLSIEFIKMCRLEKKKFFFMYGSTEATARMSYLPWNKVIKKVGSIGKAVHGGKFSIYDNKGKKILKHNKIGELMYEGKNVCLGYSKKLKDLSKGDENYGKLFTGDLAKKDAENYYYIIGRKKRFLKIFGIRINLDEIENLIKSWGHEDCACLGDDSKINIFLTKISDKSQLLESISKSIGIHKSRIYLFLIKKIPRNKAGKILYSELNY